MAAATSNPPLLLRIAVGFLLTIWALPVTIWSMLVALFFWISGSLQFQNFQTDPRMPYVWALRFNIKPRTLPDRYLISLLSGAHGGAKGAANGHVIVFRPATIDPSRKDSILLHELRHTWQFMVLGIFQPFIYLGWNIIQRPRLGMLVSYYTNPLEKDAYIFSGEKDFWQKRLAQATQAKRS